MLTLKQAQAAAESRRLQREARLAEITRARAEEAAALADAAREAEAHRKARMEAAARDEQAVRDAARAQVMREEERLVGRVGWRCSVCVQVRAWAHLCMAEQSKQTLDPFSVVVCVLCAL